MAGIFSMITNMAHCFPLWFFFWRAFTFILGALGVTYRLRLKKKGCDKIYITAIQEEIKTYYNFFFSFFFRERVVAEVGASNRICLLG